MKCKHTDCKWYGQSTSIERSVTRIIDYTVPYCVSCIHLIRSNDNYEVKKNES